MKLIQLNQVNLSLLERFLLGVSFKIILPLSLNFCSVGTELFSIKIQKSLVVQKMTLLLLFYGCLVTINVL